MSRNKVFIKTLICNFLMLSLAACDQEVDARPNEAAELAEAVTAQAGVGADAAADLQGPLSALMQACSSIEVFHYTTEQDAFLINAAPGNLFPPLPAGVQVFEEPGLANAFIAGFEFRDQQGNVVGMGTEQEVLDFVTLEGRTTYTLTMPDRGTLMLGWREDFTEFLGEIDDMVTSQEFVRTYDPPLFMVNTIPGTGHVIGGTGEFAGAHGGAIELGLIHGINLIDQTFDLEVIVVVGFQ